MITPSSTRPSLWLRVVAMTMFTLSMLWFITIREVFDWKTVVSIVLWGITIGLWTQVTFKCRREEPEPPIHAAFSERP